jgi:hypothetical protein
LSGSGDAVGFGAGLGACALARDASFVRHSGKIAFSAKILVTMRAWASGRASAGSRRYAAYLISTIPSFSTLDRDRPAQSRYG